MRTIAITIIVTIVLLSLLEVGARVYISVTRGSHTAGMQERTWFLSYEPFVMFGPNWDRDLLLTHSTAQPGVCRVLLVGGSTAQLFPITVLEQSLERIFPQKKVEVVNASMGGYVGRQEVVVAALWGPALTPNVIVSLDGANDLTHRLRMHEAGTFFLNEAYKLYLTKPFLAPPAFLLSQSQFYNGLMRYRERSHVKPLEEYMDAVAVYLDAQHSLNVLSKGMQAQRLMVLQPHSAFKVPLSPTEARFDWYKYREMVVKELYDRTHNRLISLSKSDQVGYLDSRFLYAGVTETIFTDDVHLTDLGYSRLADAIASELVKGNRKDESCSRLVR